MHRHRPPVWDPICVFHLGQRSRPTAHKGRTHDRNRPDPFSCTKSLHRKGRPHMDPVSGPRFCHHPDHLASVEALLSGRLHVRFNVRFGFIHLYNILWTCLTDAVFPQPIHVRFRGRFPAGSRAEGRMGILCIQSFFQAASASTKAAIFGPISGSTCRMPTARVFSKGPRGCRPPSLGTSSSDRQDRGDPQHPHAMRAAPLPRRWPDRA